VSVADLVRTAKGPIRLRARWVLPIDLPPIENGEVVVEDGRIASVGKAKSRNPDAFDFGLAAILPGFVNVHAHMEYTVLRGLLEEMPFFPWIRALTALKPYLTLEDWIASATYGAAEMLAAGITTVADASDAGAALAALIASGQRGIVYREVFGIEAEPPTAGVLNVLDARLRDMRAQVVRAGVDERLRIGISPHAPYTVRPDLLRALAEFAARKRLPQTIHVAETLAESQLIGAGAGPFAEMFERRKIAWQASGGSPVAYLDAHAALTPGTLAVHAVHLEPGDLAILKVRGATVAHCPKSNGKLAAGVAPLREILDAGIPVGLGTDSMVSNNAVDMFEEMRMALFQARNRAHDVGALTAREALHLATAGGAAALGIDGDVGTLRAGKRADLCAVRLDGANVTPASEDNPIGAIVFGSRSSDIAMTMVDGRVVYESGRAILLDTARTRASVVAARANLRREADRIIGKT
jgi:cytosine/adenosine deaminase-related metal-dependent hydrolase